MVEEGYYITDPLIHELKQGRCFKQRPESASKMPEMQSGLPLQV